jgi:hypothetical protein
MLDRSGLFRPIFTCESSQLLAVNVPGVAQPLDATPQHFHSGVPGESRSAEPFPPAAARSGRAATRLLRCREQ